MEKLSEVIEVVRDHIREDVANDEDARDDWDVLVLVLVAVIIDSRSDSTDLAFEALSLDPFRAEALMLPAPPRPEECYHGIGDEPWGVRTI